MREKTELSGDAVSGKREAGLLVRGNTQRGRATRRVAEGEEEEVNDDDSGNCFNGSVNRCRGKYIIYGFDSFLLQWKCIRQVLAFVLLICLIPFAWMLWGVWLMVKDIIPASRKKRKREE